MTTDDRTRAREWHEATLQLHRQQTEEIEALRRDNEALQRSTKVLSQQVNKRTS